MRKQKQKNSLNVKLYGKVFFWSWTSLLVVLVLFSIHQEYEIARRLVRNEAQIHFLKDQAFRYWASEHGGVYVPPTVKTPPNPNLSHLSNRDIETTSGMKLTLMNPAYMVRQMMEDFEELYGVRGRITSLKPLRQQNEPDKWEVAALKSFEEGVEEAEEFTDINGEPYLRYMRPMVVQESCLKCHEYQGYKIGDVRGGVGVSVSTAPYFKVAEQASLQHSIGYFLIWMLGLSGIGLGTHKINQHIVLREEAENTLKRHSEFEHLVNRVSSELVGLSCEEFNLGMNRAIKSIGEHTTTDRVYVFLFKSDGKNVDNTHEWCADGIKPEIDNLQNICIDEELPWFAHCLRQMGIFHVSDVSALPDEAKLEKIHFEKQSIQSLIVVPIACRDQLIGFLGFDSVNKPRFWTPDEQVLLRTTGESFAHVIERIRAEKALRLSEERMELVLQCAEIGTWDWDIKSGKVAINDCWAEILGYKAEELEPSYESWKELVHKEDFSEVEKTLHNHLEGKSKQYETEFRMRHKSGNWVWIFAKGQVTERDLSGKPLRACGTHLDITERKELAEERLSLEKQIQQSQKLESLGVLAGGIAHDFNNILMAVMGYTDLAKSTLDKRNSVQQYLDKVIFESKRAANVTKKMLAYSGKGNYVTEELDISNTIEDMFCLIQTCVSKNIKLDTQLQSSLPKVKADAEQIQQVIINLVTNSAEAIGEVKGTITLTTGVSTCSEEYFEEKSATPVVSGESPQPGDYVFVEVTDTGCGMDQDTQKRIFDPFFTTKFSGRGLGLAVVLGILRGHNGTIVIESQPGQGSSIQVLFPVVTPVKH